MGGGDKPRHLVMTTLRGHWSEDPRKLRFMEWLTTPRHERQPPTRVALAVELGVSNRSLTEWMNREDFRADWDKQAMTIVGSPERAQHVLDTLYRAATDPTNRQAVAAAKLYLEATNSIKPQPIEVRVAKPNELTDDELDALLAEGSAALREERNAERDNVVALPPPTPVVAADDE